MVAAFTVKIDEELRDKLDRIAAAHRRSRNVIAIEAFERYVDFELRWIEEVTDALHEGEATDERYSLDDVQASTDPIIAQARARKTSARGCR
jgi:predicted transcriptional regulator